MIGSPARVFATRMTILRSLSGPRGEGKPAAQFSIRSARRVLWACITLLAALLPRHLVEARPRESPPIAFRDVAPSAGLAFASIEAVEANTTCRRSWEGASHSWTRTAMASRRLPVQRRSDRPGAGAQERGEPTVPQQGERDFEDIRIAQIARGRATRWGRPSAISTETARKTCSSRAGESNGSIAISGREVRRRDPQRRLGFRPMEHLGGVRGPRWRR